MARQLLPAEPRDPTTGPETRPDSQTHLGTSIVNELVRPYGFMKTDRGWEWSLQNAADKFKEDPVWTSIDWISTAVPVTKWGVAAAKVSRGAGAVGKAYQAGKIAETVGAQPRTMIGRGIGAIKGREFGRAAEIQTAGPARRFRYFGNPVATDPDYIKLTNRMGADPAEARGILYSQQRELLAEEGYYKRVAEETIRLQDRAGLSGAQKSRFQSLLEGGVTPEDTLVRGALGQRGTEAYRKTFDFRNAVHEESKALGLISEETYQKNLQKYFPRLYEKYVSARTKMAPGYRGISTDHFKPRKLSEDEARLMGKIMDPTLGTDELARIGSVIAREKFAQGIAKSAATATTEEVFGRLAEAAGNPKLAKLYGLSDDVIAKIKGGADAEDVVRSAGWMTFDDLAKAGVVSPKMLSRLDDNLRNQWMDPTAAEDLGRMFETMHSKSWDPLKRIWNHGLGFFRASKTAYNPATHFRNNFGSVVFHHMATGGVPMAVPIKGIRAFMKGLDGSDFKEALRSGVVGSSFDREIRDALEAAGKTWDPRQGSAIDWLPGGFLGKWMKKGAGASERLYRAEDEVWKLDAFMKVRDKLMKGGMGRKEAVEQASLEVHRFFPSYLQHSDFTNLVRKAIPFGSFVTESVRVWKNAMTYKPHVAFFWNHMTDVASKSFAAMAGISGDEYEAAVSNLPEYTQGKKMMLWPFRAENGELNFVDMSYMIPMATMAEVEEAEGSFFKQTLLDPTSNPLMNFIAAGSTGKDPFSGRAIEPRFTERQLGIPVTGERTRRAVGLVEHAMQMMAPPLMPPGYAGINLLEAMRGQRSPVTDQPLEEGVYKTLAANFTGFRASRADVNSQILNVHREEARLQRRIGDWWNRYEWAAANERDDLATRSLGEIAKLREELTGEDPTDYVKKGVERHQPGSFSGISSRKIQEVLQRAQQLPAISPEDEQILRTLSGIQRQRRTRGRRRRGR